MHVIYRQFLTYFLVQILIEGIEDIFQKSWSYLDFRNVIIFFESVQRIKGKRYLFEFYTTFF